MLTIIETRSFSVHFHQHRRPRHRHQHYRHFRRKSSTLTATLFTLFLLLLSTASATTTENEVGDEYFELSGSTLAPDEDLFTQLTEDLDLEGVQLQSSAPDLEEVASFDITFEHRDNNEDVNGDDVLMPDPDELELDIPAATLEPWLKSADGGKIAFPVVPDEGAEQNKKTTEAGEEGGSDADSSSTTTRSSVRDMNNNRTVATKERMRSRSDVGDDADTTRIPIQEEMKVPASVRKLSGINTTRRKQHQRQQRYIYGRNLLTVNVTVASKRTARLYHNGFHIGNVRRLRHHHRRRRFRYHYHGRYTYNNNNNNELDDTMSSSPSGVRYPSSSATNKKKAKVLSSQRTFTFHAQAGDVLSVTAVGYPRSFGIKLCISVTDKRKKQTRHYGCDGHSSTKEEEQGIVAVSAASLVTFRALQLWKTRSYTRLACSWPKAIRVSDLLQRERSKNNEDDDDDGFIWASDEHVGHRVLFRFVIPPRSRQQKCPLRDVNHHRRRHETGRQQQSTKSSSSSVSPSPSMVVSSNICLCSRKPSSSSSIKTTASGKQKECYRFVSSSPKRQAVRVSDVKGRSAPCRRVSCHDEYECVRYDDAGTAMAAAAAAVMVSVRRQSDGEKTANRKMNTRTRAKRAKKAKEEVQRSEKKEEEEKEKEVRLCVKKTVIGKAEPVAKQFNGWCHKVVFDEPQAEYVPHEW